MLYLAGCMLEKRALHYAADAAKLPTQAGCQLLVERGKGPQLPAYSLVVPGLIEFTSVVAETT